MVYTADMMQPRTKSGVFASPYTEPRGAAISLRLPKTLDEQLRAHVCWHSVIDNPQLRAFVEAAIQEKLDREKLSSKENSEPTSCSVGAA